MINKEAVPKEISSIVEWNIIQLRNLFPELFSEGKIDFDKLKASLGDAVDTSPERYLFSWAGKRQAVQLLQTSSRGTLIPCEKESINYNHTENIFIEGDNFEVLNILKKSYFGQIKMIYIDPPYNIGKDFIYPDNYADPLDTYLQLTGQKDSEGNLLTSNPETSGRFHSTWLSMMYPRLYLARRLLKEDGAIFVSINDKEMHNLRIIMNEIFGEENYIGTFVWHSKKGGGSDNSKVVVDHEYVICFGKRLGKLEVDAEPLDCMDNKGPYRRGRELNKWGAASRREDRENLFFSIPGPNGEPVYPIRNDGTEGRWRTKKVIDIANRGDADFVKRPDGFYTVYEKIRSTDPRYKPYRTWVFELLDVETTADGSIAVRELFNGKKVYDYPKPVKLLKHLISLATNPDEGEIVLDFFAGSCTTSQAVLELNEEDQGDRRFICVQLPEPTPEGHEALKVGYKNIAEIGKERIRRVIAELQQNINNSLDHWSNQDSRDLGFKVFKLAESNYRQWDSVKRDPQAFIRQMELSSDPLAGRIWLSENVIYEIAIKEGYGLNIVMEHIKNVDANTIIRVTDPDKDQSFYVCLDDNLQLDKLKALEISIEDLFICRDVALDDTTAANLALQCRLKTI